MLFAEAETTWAGVAMAAIVFLSQVFLWWRQERIAKQSSAERNKITTEQTETINRTVASTAAPLAEKLDSVEKNTNGMNARLTEKVVTKTEEAARAEAVAVGLLDKVKKVAAGEPFDPDATAIREAEALAEKKRNH